MCAPSVCFSVRAQESATYSHWTLSDLLKPPTVQDVKKEVNSAAHDATAGL